MITINIIAQLYIMNSKNIFSINIMIMDSQLVSHVIKLHGLEINEIEAVAAQKLAEHFKQNELANTHYITKKQWQQMVATYLTFRTTDCSRC